MPRVHKNGRYAIQAYHKAKRCVFPSRGPNRWLKRRRAAAAEIRACAAGCSGDGGGPAGSDGGGDQHAHDAAAAAARSVAPARCGAAAAARAPGRTRPPHRRLCRRHARHGEVRCLTSALEWLPVISWKASQAHAVCNSRIALLYMYVSAGG